MIRSRPTFGVTFSSSKQSLRSQKNLLHFPSTFSSLCQHCEQHFDIILADSRCMGMIIVFLLILRVISPTFQCLQTAPGGTPSTDPDTTTVTTTTDPTDCCPALSQTLTSTDLPDGTMTFGYNSDTCRTTATATCSTTDGSTDLYAAIVGNAVAYLDYKQGSVTVSFQCSGGSWTFTQDGSTAVIETLECLLTNPP